MGGRPIVLVIDDDADIRSTLAEVLSEEGYPVLLASDGDEALDSLAHLGGEPCVVVLDMMMPVMGGEEVLRVLLEQSALPALPVVVVSATKPSFEATVGARMCLHKPISLGTFLHIVEKLSPEAAGVPAVSYSRLRSATPA
jgi:CheY-like chemotaxis protein